MGRPATSPEEFIKRSKEKYKDRFDYSLTNYTKKYTKVKIICKIHGEFEILPYNHLIGRGGCKLCNKLNSLMGIEEFIKRARKIHGNRYDYSLAIYENYNTKIKIICKIHGEFLQPVACHLRGNGCDRCARELSSLNRSLTTEEFIEKAIEVHGDKYDYSKVDYKNGHTKIEIICKEHGSFWQKPNNHLQASHGCPRCSISKGEQKILNILNKNNIDYKHQYKFKDCLSPKNYSLIFDFYLFNHNICIEYDGGQHFKAKQMYGGKDGLKYQQACDKIKNEYCKANKIKLIRIPYTKFDDIEFLIYKEINLYYSVIDELF